MLWLEVSINPLIWNPLSRKSPNWVTRVNGTFLILKDLCCQAAEVQTPRAQVQTRVRCPHRYKPSALGRGNKRDSILTLLAVHICVARTKVKVVTVLQGSGINSQLVLLARLAWPAMWLLIQALRRQKPKQQETRTKTQLRVRQFTTS